MPAGRVFRPVLGCILSMRILLFEDEPLIRLGLANVGHAIDA